jgi:peptide/nickel transport system permease protein
MIAFPSLLAIGVLGTVLGTAAAFLGKIPERVFLWLCDVFMAFPPLVIAISLIGSFGTSVWSIFIAVFFSSWVWFARLVRTWARAEKAKDYITAARISGCGGFDIVFRHIIPNVLPQCVVYLSTGVASVILLVSGFSFLGLGFPAGTAEWGAMLSDAKSYFYSHPELLLYPGLCILLTAVGFNLFGEALRDIVSPDEVCE